MKCPFCNNDQDRVVDSREDRTGASVRRRRECLKCERRFTTYEYIEDVLPMVSKRDGRSESFHRGKLETSIRKACHKRSSALAVAADIAADIETHIRKQDARTVASSTIRDLVMERLRLIDQATCIRYGSMDSPIKSPHNLALWIGKEFPRQPLAPPRKPGAVAMRRRNEAMRSR